MIRSTHIAPPRAPLAAWSLVLFFVLAAPGAAQPQQDSKIPRALVLAGGTILDVSSFGNSQSDVKDSVIVIHGGKIAAAGPKSEVKIPAGAQIVYIAGKYVVPGLNDAFSTLNNQAQANAHLYMGVTSIRLLSK